MKRMAGCDARKPPSTGHGGRGVVLLAALAAVCVISWPIRAEEQENPPPPTQTAPAPETAPATEVAPPQEPAPPAAAQPLPTDDEIKAQVEEALAHDAVIGDHATLRVSCEEGIVTIGGRADTLSVLLQAERRAGDVRGVLDVVAEAGISHAGIADSQILMDIEHAMDIPAFRGDNVAVSVTDGGVRLSGTTVTYARKLLAERCASEVAGVVSIQNNLRVIAPPEGDDAELARRIRLLLTSGMTPVPGKFEVTVVRRDALLRGKVPLYSHRVQAERLALSVGGIRTVENRLKVDPMLSIPRTTVEVTP
jgi:osmotically-inducible protein OsmY